MRHPLAALAVALGLALAGCGDDGREETTEPAPTETAPPRTAPDDGRPERDETVAEPPDEGSDAPLSDGHGGYESPEDQPGGAGDEVPARAQALFTGEGGRITPPVVRVPPFIAVRAELRSADGATYELRGGGRALRAAGEPARPVTFEGLRPGRRIVLSGPSGSVTIEASAEPGP